MANETLGVIEIKRELTDGKALLESSLAPLARQCAAQGIELRVVADDDVPQLFIDREKVAWAVSVVVGNALRHIQSGDASDVGGSVLVHLTTQSEGRQVCIAIQDDGPGIPKERLDLLFLRASGASHAPALGLSLVSDIARAHGGRVTVDSRAEVEEHFTCVTLTLPASERSNP